MSVLRPCFPSATASEKPAKNAAKMNKALDKMFEKLPIGTASRSQ